MKIRRPPMGIPAEEVALICQAASEGVSRLITERKLRNYLGYAVIVFETRGDNVSYNSNGVQEDMAKLLREIADRLAGGQSPRIITLH